MNTAHLLAQLIEIEQAVGKLDPGRIRAMLLDAQDTVVEVERKMIDILADHENLRMLVDFSHELSPSDVPGPVKPEKYFIN
ncbi:MAG TPA: hypothetical protein VL990_17700 [Acidobacteriaceae bacterium]|nr:hypothetical protein [Acidobacteriaceae bacterium]